MDPRIRPEAKLVSRARAARNSATTSSTLRPRSRTRARRAVLRHEATRCSLSRFFTKQRISAFVARRCRVRQR
jgi:hypothetical protein